MKKTTKKAKRLTLADAEKVIRRRIKKFLKDGGRLEDGTWGNLGIDDEGEIVLKDGPTCALGACLTGLSGGTQYVGEFYFDSVGAAQDLLGMTEQAVDSFMRGFDTPHEAKGSRSGWLRLGTKIRNEFLPPSSDDDYF